MLHCQLYEAAVPLMVALGWQYKSRDELRQQLETGVGWGEMKGLFPSRNGGEKGLARL